MTSLVAPMHSGMVETRDGVPLWTGMAQVEGAISADVLLTHGLGEHGSRYVHLAAALASRGVRLCTYDLRGHGRSGGPRGDLREYGVLLDDLRTVLGRVHEPGRPLFLMGHSLGGQITGNFVLQGGLPGEFRGLVLSSPWLRLAFVPPLWKLALAHATRWLAPGWTQATEARREALSRDLEHLDSLPEGHLIHGRVSARLFFTLERGARELLARADGIAVPYLLFHGDADRVTSTEASREFHDRSRSPDKRLIIYPDALHETLNDLGREKVLQDVVEWICARMK